MATHPNAIVIGAGAIGCSAAYYLAKAGCSVRLLDARKLGSGCSNGNCGFICPSHALPLTMPGTVRRAIRGMFNRDSALYIKPRFDPKLWYWLVQFALRCRRQDVLHISRARDALLASSMKLYHSLLAEESINVEWENRGLLFVYRSSRELAAYELTAELIHREFGIEVKRYDGERLRELEPSISPGFAGGWYCPGDAHLRPDRLMSEFVSLLRLRGIEILEGTKVSRFDTSGDRARGIETSKGVMTADIVVVAAGAESAAFAKQLGCRLPIQPGKGYSITMPRPANSPRIPIIFEDSHVAVTPWSSGLRIGSTMEFVGYDRMINSHRIELFKKVAKEYFVESLLGPIQTEWYGWRPMTYDELPCIGRSPKLRNVFVAAGHGMIGMATMTATGKLVSELALELEPHIDPMPFALTRFNRY